LQEETGVDTGFRRCGGIYLALDSHEAQELNQAVQNWRAEGIAAEELDANRLRELAPELLPEGNVVRLDELAAGSQPNQTSRPDQREQSAAAVYLPDEAQIRNPRHLKALEIACRRQGVAIESGVAAEDFEIQQGRLISVRANQGPLRAGRFVFASGAWSASLVRRLGGEIALRPVRGQIVLLSSSPPLLRQIVNRGPRYLVPREDGRLLIGSTEEDVGFNKQTTSGAVSDLLRLAHRLVPESRNAQVERAWAGLRPGTADRLPYLGRLPGLDNAFVATGHFRGGLTLSPGTARVMGQLLRDEPTEIDLSPFALDRR
ncbi:MAG: FAD-dependent oxidoreductase, partial [Planctomycetales bacterium]